MNRIDCYIPTRVLFGPGRLEELASAALPGKKALICVTSDGLMEKLGIQSRVAELLAKNGVESVVYDGIAPNPTKTAVVQASDLARREGCDFFVGLGGGSSIDTAKAAAILLENPGDLWDYAYTGTGGRREIAKASPVVAVSTTSGTGTETDPYCVITNEETDEKLDFAVDAIFPALVVIDPELMLTLPRSLTIYQGFDALFHAAECFITNRGENRLVDLFAGDAVSTVARWLPVAAADGSNLEARTHMAYAADILCGYTQALISTTSHHITGQTMGGLWPKLPHGASLIMIAEEYYGRVREFVPEIFDQLGTFMGRAPVAGKPGQSFLDALTALMDETGVRRLAMSEYGIRPEDAERIAKITVDEVGIGCDKYPLTREDIQGIVARSYR